MGGIIHKSSKGLKGTALQITGSKALLFELRIQGTVGIVAGVLPLLDSDAELTKESQRLWCLGTSMCPLLAWSLDCAGIHDLHVNHGPIPTHTRGCPFDLVFVLRQLQCDLVVKDINIS